MMNSLHFGAGKIGRGFIGAALVSAGYKVTFADVDSKMVSFLNEEGGYTVHIMDKDSRDIRVEGVSAVLSSSEDAIRSFVEADLVTTAVSVKVLPLVAPVIAAGIKARQSAGVEAPLNVIACENGVRATSMLKGFVCEILGDTAWAQEHVGFVDCSVDRIVPPISFENPLDVAVEEFYEWNVERSALKGLLPAVPGMNLVDDLEAHIERKLFTLNTGHCTTAYLGSLRGYTYIFEALGDSGIISLVRSVMRQSGDALVKKHGLDHDQEYEYIELILNRFRNPYLKDTLARVGRDPMRKLSAPLYFSYPLMMARSLNLPFDRLSLAAAAGFRFNDASDPQSVTLQGIIKERGIEAAVREVTLIKDESVIAAVVSSYEQIPSIL